MSEGVLVAILSEAQQCAAVALDRSYAPRSTSAASVWNGLALVDQNAIRRDLGLPPLKNKSRLRGGWVPRRGDEVRLKKTVTGVPKDAWKTTAKIYACYPDIPGGLRLSSPLGGMQAWNAENLVLVRRAAR